MRKDKSASVTTSAAILWSLLLLTTPLLAIEDPGVEQKPVIERSVLSEQLMILPKSEQALESGATYLDGKTRTDLAASPEHDCWRVQSEWSSILPDTSLKYSAALDGSIIAFLFGYGQEFHTVEINTLYLDITDMSANAGDVTIHLYENGGEYPDELGALVYTETFPASWLLANGPGLIPLTLSSPVAIDGQDFWVGYSVDNWTDPNPETGDYVSFGLFIDYSFSGSIFTHLFDPNDSGWHPLDTLFGGIPVEAKVEVDLCYIYSYCGYFGLFSGEHYQTIPANIGASSGEMLTGLGRTFFANNDSLKTVKFDLYVGQIQQYVGSNELNGLEISIWGDDGSGQPDILSGPLATQSIPPGLANIFPVTSEDYMIANYETHEIDFSSYNLVFQDDFHVTVGVTGDQVTDGAVSLPLKDGGSGGLTAYDNSDNWTNSANDSEWITYWGDEARFGLDAYVCLNEFQQCEHEVLYTAQDWSVTFSLGIDSDHDGTIDGAYNTIAQKIDTRGAAKIEKVRFLVASNYWYDGTPIGNMGAIVHIWNPAAEGGPGPGDLVWSSDTILIDDSMFNEIGEFWVEILGPDTMTSSYDYAFWIGIEGVNLGGDLIRLPNDGYLATKPVYGGSYLHYLPWNQWISTEEFGLSIGNWWIEVDYCGVITLACSGVDPDLDGLLSGCDDCTDSDNDGYGDPGYPANTCPTDNCPDVANHFQEDSDADGVGDACDLCPNFDDFADADLDSIPDSCDNCPDFPNPNQLESGIAGVGESCCCGYYTGGYPGNTNCDPEGKRNLADVTRLVDMIYISKTDLCCRANGNVDGDLDQKISLGDITKLIDLIYISKNEAEPCL